jgi:hypothetical protein
MRTFMFAAMALGLAFAPACKDSSRETPVVSQSPANDLDNRVTTPSTTTTPTTTTPSTMATPVAPDNTGRNDEVGGPTADQQKNDSYDVDKVAQIRKALVDDDSLSTDAHNVKVISENGHVTLRGPVDTAAEKSAVEAKAASVVGANNVINELEVVH